MDPDRALWQSPADRGDVPVSDAAFYWSVTGTAEEAAMLARVVLSRRQRSVDLLPAGRATAQVAATVALPKRGAGQPIRLGFGLRLRRIAEEAERGDHEDGGAAPGDA